MDKLKAEILVREKRLAVNQNDRLHCSVRRNIDSYYMGLIHGLKGSDYVAHCVEGMESALAKSL